MRMATTQMLRFFGSAVLYFLASVALPARAEIIIHQASGIAIPAEIAGFKRDRVADYESQTAGLGFGYHFNTPSGVIGSIYIYKAGMPSVPSDISHPVMGQLREQTIREITQLAHSRGESVRPIMNGTLKISTLRGEIPVLFDAFSIGSSSGSRTTYAWLWGSRDHILKIRVTRPPLGMLDPALMKEFYETVVRLAAPVQQAARRMDVAIMPNLSAAEMAVWMGYGISLANWITKNGLRDFAPEGPWSPSFEAEVEVRSTQVQIWREMREKSSMPLAYMDAMLRVATSGFLREYIWRHHQRPNWGAAPADLQMANFLQWSIDNLRDHSPQTKSSVIFGPVLGK